MRRAFYSFAPLALLVFLLARGPLSDAPLANSGDAASASSAAEPSIVVREDVLEARRALASTPAPARDEVRLAATDAGRIHLFELPKEIFLSRGATASVRSSLGETLSVEVVRANGVNTAVRIRDESGRDLLPLAVQYPIEREGEVREVAYYTSVHPSLASKELGRQGAGYIRTMLARAAATLASKGERISPEIVAAAERLAVVEHADHKRFMRENRAALFDEINALYALNAGDTYRYSVSSAGAGGMIQMIAPTYATTRARHPHVGLKSDFVEGMRDHSNALQAMLLYMQDTWNDLLKQEEIRAALAEGVATQPELLAAGYNSNPARLALYIERGGHGWRTLIPRETQMYLQIYAAVEAHGN